MLFRSCAAVIEQQQIAAEEYGSKRAAVIAQQQMAAEDYRGKQAALAEKQQLALQDYRAKQAAEITQQQMLAQQYCAEQAELQSKQSKASAEYQQLQMQLKAQHQKISAEYQQLQAQEACHDSHLHKQLLERIAAAQRLLSEVQVLAARIERRHSVVDVTAKPAQLNAVAPSEEEVTEDTQLLATENAAVTAADLYQDLALTTEQPVVRASQTLTRYQIPLNELKSSELYYKYLKRQANYCYYSAIGSGVFVGGSGFSLIAVGIASGMLVGFACSGALMIVLGIMLSVFGLQNYKHWQEQYLAAAKKLSLCKQLNQLTQVAYEHYVHHRYQQFLRQLATVYEVSESIAERTGAKVTERHQLLDLHKLNHASFADHSFIKPLLNNGFRPDMVAYLLSILAEVLLNYNEEPVIVPLSPNEQVIFPAVVGSDNCQAKTTGADIRPVLALQVWQALIGNKDLVAEIPQWHLRLQLGRLFSQAAIQEHQHDAAELSFNARLQELVNLAKINLAILSLTRLSNNQVGLKTAGDLADAFTYYWQVKQSIANKVYFLARPNVRLNALTDFFIASIGVAELAERERVALGQQEPAVEPGKQSSSYLSYLSQEQQLAKAESLVNAAIAAPELSTQQGYINVAEECVAQAQAELQRLGYCTLTSLAMWRNAALNYQAALSITDKHCLAILQQQLPKIDGLLLSKPQLISAYGQCLLACCCYSELAAWLQAQYSLLQQLTANQAMTIVWQSTLAADKVQLLQRWQQAYFVLEAKLERKRYAYATAQAKLIAALDIDNSASEALQEQQLLQAVQHRAANELLAAVAFKQSDPYQDLVLPSARYYKILALDGGNFFASLVPAYILCEIESRIRRPITSLFNAVVGLGSSAWLAAGLCVAADESKSLPLYSAADLITLYTDWYSQQQAFTRAWSWTYKYTDVWRKQFFSQIFAVKQLGNSLPRLELALRGHGYAQSSGGRVWLSSQEHSQVAMVPAVLAATAMPGVFKANTSLQLPARAKASYYSEPASSHSGILAYDHLLAGQQSGAESLLVSFGAVKAQTELHDEEAANDSLLHDRLGDNYYRWQFFRQRPVASHELVADMSDLAKQHVVELYNDDSRRFSKLLDSLEDIAGPVTSLR